MFQIGICNLVYIAQMEYRLIFGRQCLVKHIFFQCGYISLIPLSCLLTCKTVISFRLVNFHNYC